MTNRLFLVSLLGLLVITTSFINFSETGVSESKTTTTTSVPADYDDYIALLYSQVEASSAKLDYDVFKQGVTGFFGLKAQQAIDNNLLTIIDFSRSANDERLWIVDMNQMKVVHTSLVSHGRNSGELYATQFSNTPSSYKSSLGFYTTGDIYTGKHGTSLLLNGVERGINDKARERAIVMHSADYVSHDFIRSNGRLGRSQGCPAIPLEDHQKIITMLSGGSCLYIYHPDAVYHGSTQMLVTEKALAGLVLFLGESPNVLAQLPGFSKLVRTI